MQKWSRGVFKIILIILLSVGVYSFIGHYQSQNEIYEPQDFSVIITNGVKELSSEINQLVNATRLFKNKEISVKFPEFFLPKLIFVNESSMKIARRRRNFFRILGPQNTFL